MSTRRLPMAARAEARLELPTIMDRALAAKHRGPYVQLAAFAIDVDRVYAEEAEAPVLPFGWEVFLTQCYLVAHFDATLSDHLTLLEDTCLSILEQPPEEQGYGSQLLFAVYDAVDRGQLPTELKGLFRSWRSRPKLLQNALAPMWAAPAEPTRVYATHCLAQALDPPIAPPSREVLVRMAGARISS